MLVRYVLGLVVAVALGGCSDSPAESVDGAVRATIQEGSAHVEIKGDTSLGEQSYTITGEGDFDYAELRGSGSFDFSDLPLGETGGDLGEQGQGEVIFDGPTFYMKAPFLSQLSPQLDAWIKFDADALSLPSDNLAQLGQNDPSQVLTYLNGATSVTESGSENIDGFETTRYDLTIDYRAAKDLAPARLEAAYDSIIVDLEIERAPGMAWVDEDGFVRRMSYEWTLGPEVTGAPAETTQIVELEFSEFGRDVTIELPPPDEVVDFNELVGEHCVRVSRRAG